MGVPAGRRRAGRGGGSGPMSPRSRGEAASSAPASSERVQCPQPGDQVASSANSEMLRLPPAAETASRSCPTPGGTRARCCN